MHFLGGERTTLSSPTLAMMKKRSNVWILTSLFPFVLKWQRFPFGHPEIIQDGFKPIENYFGFVKCEILPPKDLHHPVISLHVDGKLMLPLCSKYAKASCIREEDTEYVNVQGINHRCEHSNDERVLIGTWTAEEISMVQKVGHIVMALIEVAH